MFSQAIGPPLSVAPMVDRSDRHFRAMMRCLTRRTLLYSPMITTHAIIHGPRERLLKRARRDAPVALQLGGDSPADLAMCARIGVEHGFDEINLNVGCPSSRVQGGNFGAVMMREPQRVAECVSAMIDAVDVPVTVKHRIGVDELDRYEDMLNFVDTVAAAGAARFTVHARKAWLKGLSPKQNRTVPPLRHGEVAQLKRERPALFIETNGGITTLEQVREQLEVVDAVMLGRAAWDTPMIFAEADSKVFEQADAAIPSAAQVVRAFLPHAITELESGTRPVGVLRNLLNLFHGQPGARAFKRGLQALAQAPFNGGADFESGINSVLAEQAEAVARLHKTPA